MVLLLSQENKWYLVQHWAQHSLRGPQADEAAVVWCHHGMPAGSGAGWKFSAQCSNSHGAVKVKWALNASANLNFPFLNYKCNISLLSLSPSLFLKLCQLPQNYPTCFQSLPKPNLKSLELDLWRTTVGGSHDQIMHIIFSRRNSQM